MKNTENTDINHLQCIYYLYYIYSIYILIYVYFNKYKLKAVKTDTNNLHINIKSDILLLFVSFTR